MKIRNLVVAALGGVSALAFASPASAQEFYMGQILNVGFNFCPTGTLEAAGQILPIQQNAALFSLLGTTYGGNGSTTFALPDLRGRTPLGQGQGPGLQFYAQGQAAGVEQTTLLSTQLPAHTHVAVLNGSSGAAANPSPSGNALATFPAGTPVWAVAPPAPTLPMAANSVQVLPAGNGLPVSIRDPYLTTRYCITTTGIFPSRP